MKLYEYQGKELFRKAGISIPRGIVVDKVQHIKLPGDELVVKTQVLTGGRGKAGGVQKVKKSIVGQTIQSLLKKKIKGEAVKEVLVEEAVNIDKELYLSLTIDKSKKNIVLIYSESGGIDIEELAHNHPEQIKKINFHQLNNDVYTKIKKISTLSNKIQLINLVKKLFMVMKKYDATLVEINPLILTKRGKLMAADAKVVIDDNALYRQKFTPQEHQSEIEHFAEKHGLHYVELDGDIGVIGNGAGLVMATLDMVKHYHCAPANFLDVRGGTGATIMEKSMQAVFMKKGLKAVLINIFAGITHADEIAQGIINFQKKHPQTKKTPIVIRMIGTEEKHAQELLEQHGLHTHHDLTICVKQIMKLTRGK